MFVAGDPSGDLHASPIIQRLSIVLPGVRCFGIGGPAMQSVGFESLMRFEEFNRMGLWEVLVHLPFFLKAQKRLVTAMDSNRPKALVCIDYPGLNIPLMREAHKRGIPVVWYIVPQVWAWKKKRAALLGKYASFIAVVFPFEVDFFNSYPAPISFVGHPLVEAMQRRTTITGTSSLKTNNGSVVHSRLSREADDKRWPQYCPPWSRQQSCLSGSIRIWRFSFQNAAGLPLELYQKPCAQNGIKVFEGPLCDLLDRTHYAFVTSGTATLETALAGVPMVIVYRTSPVTYWLLKRMIRVPYIGLPNIVADEKIVPECIQQKAKGHALAREMQRFIESPEYYEATIEKLSRLKGILGNKQPSVELAEKIASLAKII